MNTLKWYRRFFAPICLTLVLALNIGNVTASPALQGEPNFAAIDAYISTQQKDLGIPGMALGIVWDGQIAHLQGFGTADSSGRAVTPQTPFYLGSVTKSFTALAVMQLVEAGQVDLDAPVQTYLPWFELADKEASAKITVRNLLNQTSGISEKDGNRFWTSKQELEEKIRGLDTIQLTRPVGTTFQYSNLNYDIAGLIVEKISGQPYAEYISQHVFEPLDMRHSYASRAAALADGLAAGHHYMFGRVFGDEGAMPPAQLPSGFLIASAEDLTHYAMAQLNEGRYGEPSILSPQGIAELHAPAILTKGGDPYGMGWAISPWDGTSVVWHGGDSSRFLSQLYLLPERGSAIVLLSNASGYEQESQVHKMATGVLMMLYDKPSPGPVSLPFGTRFQYWALLLTPFLLIAGIVLVWRNRERGGIWLIILTAILNLAVVFAMFRLALNRITLPSMLVFHPELGYALIAIATIGIGWSVVYTAMSLRTRRSRKDFPPG